MKNKITLKGKIRAYLRWPLYLSGYLIVTTLGVLYYNRQAGAFLAISTLVYVLIALTYYFTKSATITSAIVEFAASYGQVQKELLKGFVIPYALMGDDGRFVWQNDACTELFQKDTLIGKSVTSLIPGLTKDKLPTGSEDVEYEFSIEGRDFKATLRRLDIGLLGGNAAEENADTGYLIAMHLFDETELNEYIRRNWEESMITGLVYMDNLEEALASVHDEVRRQMLQALVDKKINNYFDNVDGLVRRVDADKYFVVLKRIGFDKLAEDKFSILEDVKNVKVGQGGHMAVTLSMGFGLGGASYQTGANFAKNAMDLALGRGGDQAVIKSPDTITYFGGKREQVEKTTRVKARVKAHALREIIEHRDRVIVMGHARPDVDSFGSAVGIYRAAASLDKECYIVINEVTSAIKPMYDTFIAADEKHREVIVNSQEAISHVNHQTVLVVVDTNRPSITDCPELLKLCKTIVVLDHHRLVADKIENATLSYVESYASSASEMVSEILQYMGDDIKLKKDEADCLYAGIMIDTDNFAMKAGVRTFEAAAFLRRSGADVTRVRKMFRGTLDEYKVRAEAVRNAEIFMGVYAISVCPSENINNPTIVGAKAANELMNIESVKASFIFTLFNDKVYISARSIDEVNVQLIMEKLGGGGHLNIAGAQLQDMTVEAGIRLLKQTLQDMVDEGEL